MGAKLCGTNRTMCNRVEGERVPGLYHEKQEKELCAMHALNNLLQDKDAFTQKDMDRICNELSPSFFFNPHRSMFGTGNYDVNVIMAAMQAKKYDVIWFDKRRDVDELNLDNIVGFILNMPSDYKLGGFIPFNFNRKHWIAIRQIDNVYYNLDSKLKCPELIGDGAAVKQYFRSQLLEKDRELLFAVTEEVQKAVSWKVDCNENHPANGTIEVISNGHTKPAENELAESCQSRATQNSECAEPLT